MESKETNTFCKQLSIIKSILSSLRVKSKWINFKENVTRIFIDILEKYQVDIVLKKEKKEKKEKRKEKKIRGKSLTFMRRKQIMLKTERRGEGVQR